MSTEPKILRILALAFLLLGGIFAFPFDLPPLERALFRYAVSVVLTVMLMISIASWYRGDTVDQWLRELDIWLARWTERQLLNWAGLEDSLSSKDAKV